MPPESHFPSREVPNAGISQYSREAAESKGLSGQECRHILRQHIRSYPSKFELLP
jgi:hypothetical protein